MNNDINKYIALRNSLLLEQANIVARLKEIENALNQTTSAPTRSTATTATPSTPVRKKWKMSRAGRAKIKAAALARWAKIKGTPVAAPKKLKGKISAAGRARISAAQKARWAKARVAPNSKAAK